MTKFGAISGLGKLFTRAVRPVPVKTIYVRPGGNDSYAGTLARPLASLMEAFNRVPTIIEDARYVIDLTGYTQTNQEVFHMPAKYSALPANLILDGGNFVNDFNRAPLTLLATPTVSQTLTVTGQAADAVTGLVTLTTSNNLTLNQLRGALIQGANVTEYGVVAANTAGPNSTVYVTNAGFTFTAPVQILALSCELALGDTAETYNVSQSMDARCDIAFTGIKLTKANDAFGNLCLNVRGGQHALFTLCEIQGLYAEHAGLIRFDGCYFNSGLLSAYGTQFSVYTSYLKNVNVQFHGEGGIAGQGYYLNVVEGCTPLGHHNNFQSEGGFDISQCDIISPKANGSPVGAATYGVLYRGSAHARVEATKINGATAGVYCEGPGYMLLSNVQGTNTDVGCDLHDGAYAKHSGGTAVTGTNGDVRLGDAGIITWATAPAHDLDQGVRVS